MQKFRIVRVQVNPHFITLCAREQLFVVSTRVLCKILCEALCCIVMLNVLVSAKLNSLKIGTTYRVTSTLVAKFSLT